MPEKLTPPDKHDLDNIIGYWENELFHNKFLMSPSVQYLVEKTLKFLKHYKELVEK